MIAFKVYLLTGVGLFSIGLWGAMSQRGIVMIIMAIELMLNAANIEILTFWRYSPLKPIDPHMLALALLTIAAVEEAFGLGIALMIYRQRRTQNVDRFAEMAH